VVRYADVALLASMLRDELLVTSLRELYLDPLEEERDGGAVARQTLKAYVAAERNVSSAAAALGVSRRTVGNRLRMIERRLNRPLPAMIAAIEAALHLDALDIAGAGSPTLGRSPTRPITNW
jgi:DNA-binding PucR family transcriptional regulator